MIPAPKPDQPSPEPHVPLAVVCSLDAVLRDSVATGLLLDAPDLAVLRYDLDAEGDLRRLVLGGGAVLENAPVVLEHECIACTMREDALPVLEALAQEARWEAIALLLPVAADPAVVMRTLIPRLERLRAGLVAAVVDADSAAQDLLGDATLTERSLCWGEGDERSVGEALAAQIEYVDLVALVGDPAGPGAELIEHLRAPDQLLLDNAHDVTLALLTDGAHDLGTAGQRIDPAAVEAHHGPAEHGTWTLDLVSDRPFHPDRFLEHAERLGAGRLRGRGHFWFPTRPGTICQWDGAGGQVSLGAHGFAGTEDPTTRLVVTGVDPADAQRVREAFEDCLLTAQEWQAGLSPWLGREDDLTPWLGERTAAAAYGSDAA
ncbi:GTP-binding protein [Brachybacterium sp.]|uniref:GTP-binding protein n=1 Tax=Brachybacterium sp. TaxID=1891286 RepID=UPI002ED29700